MDHPEQIRVGGTVRTTVDAGDIKCGTVLRVIRVDGPIVFAESPSGNEVWYDSEDGEVELID
jgi:hypothetical protein